MAGRFPGAVSVEQLWNMLDEGRDGITRFTLDTLDASVSAAVRADPEYVMARGILDGIEAFDAAFFGIAPREAEVMDPQHRVFLEIAWECLERAGHAPDRIDVPVGVYAGVYTAVLSAQACHGASGCHRARRRLPGHGGQRQGFRGHAGGAPV